MASAFKCDRCGRLYPDTDRSIKFQIGSNTYISNLWIGNTDSWDSGPKDICPDCARDFKIWWEHSNISAQYQLSKMISEMNSHKAHTQDTQPRKFYIFTNERGLGIPHSSLNFLLRRQNHYGRS